MWTACLALLVVAGASLAAAQPPLASDAETFRVTAARVQLSALFLDGNGQPVTDIRPEEVTVRQAGQVVRLADLAYQPRTWATATSGTTSPRLDAPVGAPSTEEEPWVFLLDDLAISPDAFARAKSGLLALLERGLPHGVQVGILRTGVRGTHTTRLSDDRDALLREVTAMRLRGTRWRGGPTSLSGATTPGPAGSRDRVFIEGTLGSLNSLLLSLQSLPGRKVVVVLSELIGLTADEREHDAAGTLRTVTPNVQYNGVAGRLRRLGQLAAETGVTVHTVDLAGVVNTSLSERAKLGEGLHAVADELGGLHFSASNDVGALLGRLVVTERGHYILAYEPPAGTFDDGGKARFVDVSISVSRPGVTVTTRRGFFTR